MDRIRRLERQRQIEQEDRERLRSKQSQESSKLVKNDFTSSSPASSSSSVTPLKAVGLVSLSEYEQREAALGDRLAAEATANATGTRTGTLTGRLAKRAAEPGASAGGSRGVAKRPAKKAKLSFDDDDDDGGGEAVPVRRGSPAASGSAGAATTPDDDAGQTGAAAPAGGLRLGKNPNVDTSFLPDAEREAAEQREREELAAKWRQQQEAMKAEPIQITYSFWDGSGHRASVEVRKGDSIATFLDRARREFDQLRGVPVDNLLYIKEDLIIPHHYTFYDFIVNRARGKSGPLFHFDVREDVRLAADARVERDESHAGKVCERRWYERNKHIFPASRWEVYDPEKDYGAYTIGDRTRANQ
ncbi:hypothetical protein H696_02006 [Fonticula alba]|uniref:FAM50A/XAP5 C-terminal domain-containing protein n=1 Tax=Fonticula alba TaxID=691883 RepID=A0A058ZAU4_FONAL|nr:hypothetical protein H696_02006 [Fonticula alba]KCV71056.1 hypothetical protein H696_02006 [Fonticula alba]|eukprot:XP_009494179.1 hypothetical protein H696_02006 [Fonticula alba]